MPIRPENRARYPKDWKAISLRIRRVRADNRCEQCGVKNYEVGGRTSDGEWHKARITGCDRKLPMLGTVDWCEGGHKLRIVRIILTVAHLDHTPENCDDANLRAMCQRCHNLYDSAMRRAGTRQRQFIAQACGDLFGGAAGA